MEFIEQIPVIGNPVITVVALIAALSVIITVHEYGHYIVGRWCGIHAEVFSLGFGPVLFSRTDKRGTRWQIAAVPLGGYVKFLGDADAASARQDESFLEHVVHAEREKELRRTMLGAPLWARAATVAAGPIFNFILGAVIFTGAYLVLGTATERPIIGAFVPIAPGAENGLEVGDEILAVEGRTVDNYGDLFEAADELPISPEVSYRVRRNGAEIEARGPWPHPANVDFLTPGGAAISAGLKVGDVIVSADGSPIIAFRQIYQLTRTWPEGHAVSLGVWREGEVLEFTLSPKPNDLNPDGSVEQRRLVGFSSSLIFEPAVESMPFGQAVVESVKGVGRIMVRSVEALHKVATGAISQCNIRGVVTIARTARDMAKQGPSAFIQLIASLSVAIGLINLFPIPVLDGGHLVFHAYEAIFRRPPAERVLNVLMTVGLTLIVAFMSFALINDFRCP